MALARAIYSQAQVILLDDVLAAVDANTQSHLVDAILALSSTGQRTVVLVTHVQTVARQAKMVVLLEVGLIKKYGKPTDVLDNGAAMMLEKSEKFSSDDKEALQAWEATEQDPLTQAEVTADSMGAADACQSKRLPYTVYAVLMCYISLHPSMCMLHELPVILFKLTWRFSRAVGLRSYLHSWFLLLPKAAALAQPHT